MDRTDIGRKDRNDNPAWLDAPAAASLARVDAARGRPVEVDWAGRTRDEQQRLWDKYGHNPAKAARPGTSPHEFGNAVDTDEHTEPGFVELMHEHGWRRPLKKEPWHFVHWTKHDTHVNDPAPTPATITALGDPMSLRIIDSPFYRAAGNRVIHNGSAAMSVPAGWVQDMIQKGNVPYVAYDNDNDLQTEVNLVWQLGGFDNDSAAAKTAQMMKALE